MESQLMLALSSRSAGKRRSALQELRNMGEDGAANMGYHEEAYAMLNDPEPSVQVAAIQALAYMGKFGAAYCDVLVAKLTSSSEHEIKRAAVQALGFFGEEASPYGSAVESCLDDEDLDLVVEACIALGNMKATQSAGKIVAKLKEADTEVVIGACIGLGSMDAEVEALSEMLGSKEARIRAAAIGAMPQAKAEKYLNTACNLLADPDVYVRINAVKLISALGEKAVPHIAEIGKLLHSSEVGARVAAAAALAGMGATAESAVDSLEQLLCDTEEDTGSQMMSVAGVQSRMPATLRKPACAAAVALAAMGERAAKSISKIAEGLASADSEVRISCAIALGKMARQSSKFEDQLISLLDDPQPLVVAAACSALGSMAQATGIPSPLAAAKMAELVKHIHPAVKGAALNGLSSMREEAIPYIEDFIKCFAHSVGYVRAQAIVATAACGELGQMYAAEVCRMMFDEDPRVRLAAVNAMLTMGKRGAAFADEIIAVLHDPTPEVRVACIKALGSLGSNTLSELMPAIMQVADGDPYPAVREAAKSVAGLRALEE